MSAPALRGARPVHLTPFGLYSRYMLAAYLRHTLMVTAALMTVALTIDLWPQVALFSGDPFSVTIGLGRLAILRLADLLPPFVPFAAFLGVVWSESAFTVDSAIFRFAARRPGAGLRPWLLTSRLSRSTQAPCKRGMCFCTSAVNSSAAFGGSSNRLHATNCAFSPPSY